MIRWDETKESSLNLTPHTATPVIPNISLAFIFAGGRDTETVIYKRYYLKLSRIIYEIILSLQEGETVLHVAATSGQLETVEALLDRGCDANVQDFVSLLILK